nr:MAG TPA: phosphoadenosine-phosphosulfate reductase [Caudoviricetes sp.]
MRRIKRIRRSARKSVNGICGEVSMDVYLPGFEPDAAERAQLRFVGGVLDLRQFDKILISVSGGKDSHAMLWLVRDLADRQGVPREKLLAMYADTGMEWHNAGEHVQRLCKAAGIKLETVYPVRPMLETFKKRMKIPQITTFPNTKCRFCTSYHKADPMDKLTSRYSGKLLRVTGERWAESKARSTYTEFVSVSRLNSRERIVFGWRPMLAFSEADIWAMVRDTGVPRHVCYEMGCGRLGCAGCIFSKDHELRIEMRENPTIFEALDRLEAESGYAMNMSGKRIRDRIK